MSQFKKFIDAIDAMLAANPRNSKKSEPVIDWFRSEFSTHGRASVVAEAKQAYNRVPEQFKHGASHVVFVATDKAAVHPLVNTARERWYPELESVLVLEWASGAPGPATVLSSQQSPVVGFYDVSLNPKKVTVTPPAAPNANPIHATVAIPSLHWDKPFLASTSELVGLDDAAKAAIAALKAGKHVVFYGPPGTGKTTLAQKVAEHVGAAVDLCTGTSDWTTFETLGGYFPVLERGDDNLTAPAMDFNSGVVTRAIEKGHWLIVDELNRADVDKAFGELLTLLAGAEVRLPHRKLDDGEYRELQFVHEGELVDPEAFVVVVPGTWRLLGTMNTFDKSALYQLSYAFMRRFAFIEVTPPQSADYKALLTTKAGDWLPTTDPRSEVVVAGFVQLFTDEGPGTLAALDLRIGPSIALDCIRMSGTLLAQSAALIEEDAALEACSSLLLPQFEGREREHLQIKEAIVKALGLSDSHAEVLDRRLGIWTGANA